ncbi:hypothetical protein AOLI_G00151850 [Acnodon oligacanthus]
MQPNRAVASQLAPRLASVASRGYRDELHSLSARNQDRRGDGTAGLQHSHDGRAQPDGSEPLRQTTRTEDHLKAMVEPLAVAVKESAVAGVEQRGRTVRGVRAGVSPVTP